jgi:ribonuclease HI
VIEIWADGSSSGKSNLPGGWAFVIMQDDRVLSANYGGEPSTTNNAMELEGARQGLLAWSRMVDRYPDEKQVTLISDSQTTLGLATGQYTPSKNVERATELRWLYHRYCTGIRWVRGHVGILANERCDRLAKKGRKEQQALLSKRDDTNGRDPSDGPENQTAP